MPTLYRDTGFTLTHLIEDIKRGNIALPDIQRPFVWSAAKVRDLFDSMYRGYPVGTLMLWETLADVGTRQVGGGDTDRDRVAKLLIVDGQQRLTSLFAVLTGRSVLTKAFEKKHIKIAFRPTDETFEVTDAAIEHDPEFIPDITVLWTRGYKPTVRNFMTRLGASRHDDFGHVEQDHLEERIDRVRDLRDFRFQVIELNAKANEEQVADIFVRTNSKGVTLNQADFILTLMSVHWEKGRVQLEAFCRNAVDPPVRSPSPKNAFLDPRPDQILRAGVGLAFRRGRLQHVYNILRGKDLDTGDVTTERRNEQFEKLRQAQDEVTGLTNWHEFLKCLKHAGFRSGRMIASENAVIYTYVLWLIGKCDFGLDTRTLRGLVARWFFMAHTTGRYTSSPESQIEADFGRIVSIAPGNSRVFREELDRIIRSNFTGDYWEISLPNRLDTSGAKSPVLLAYWAALNLLDAEVLFSKLKIRELLDPGITPPRSIERHHLFPKAYLATKGVTARSQVNAIANMAFLDWSDNVAANMDSPSSYWPALTYQMAPDRLEKHRRWHALPVGWEQLDYSTFLEKRRSLIAKVVRDGFECLRDDVVADRPLTLAELLESGESDRLEYKSTARWNLHTCGADKRIEHAIVKTVCGFLNAEGGTLLIGVGDDGTVLGLDDDMKTLRARGHRDGYQLFLRQCLDDNLSLPTAGIVRIRFEQVAGADVCVVATGAAGKPVFSKAREGTAVPNEFWVRVGNATKQLHGDDMIQYQLTHWN